MSEEMLSRVANVMGVSEAPAPAAPKAEAPPVDNSLDTDDLELASEPDQDEPAPTEDAPFDGVELELGQEVKKLTKAEIKAIVEEHGTFKQSAESLKAQQQAVAQQHQSNQQIAQLAPHVEALRAEGRILQSFMQGLYQEVKALTESDPLGAFQKQQQLNELSGRFNQLAQQEAQASGALKQWQSQANAAKIQAEIPVLLNKLPQWKDQTVRERDQKFIREYMHRNGYTQEHIDLATDSRYISTLLDAAKYQAIKGARASKKIDGAPQMARPGSPANGSLSKVLAKSEYNKAIKAAPTDAAKAKIVQKRFESML